MPGRSRSTKAASTAGFVEHEMIIALGILGILLVVGTAVSDALGLRGLQALIPPAVVVGLAVAFGVAMHVSEAIRKRRKRKEGQDGRGDSGDSSR